ncbi:hypothetical protein M3936_14115 [Sutcliffiella horikoshii]|uniref:hypothetical protein n=1 Tax=Sutcliffiella horikoshii TaxID=79883 RepID=UPI00203DBDCF|nr:hypothetical protein [Sutcliffiella horikoshii]MCM3618722.1 hypothetical protein [Sutcliffiella horikoshii]
MAQQITLKHLQFVKEASDAFQIDPVLETYWNKDVYDYMALRFGADRDCVMVYELGGEVANFVQQMDPQPAPREEVRKFSHAMESMLASNDHKGHWKNEHHEYLNRELERNHLLLIKELLKEDQDKYEITQRCANIANFAMMISDNYGGGKL